VRRTYLDWNATAPPLDAVVDAMRDAAREAWGNPSSIHGEGRLARAKVEEARAAVAALAGCDVRDVVLTSGGTEANNLAVRSFFADGPGVLVTSRLEHPSVGRVAEVLERAGTRAAWVDARPDGTIDMAGLSRALEACEGERVLVAVQAVNGETGVVQPVDEIIALARARRAETRVHVDAVQAWGKLESVAPGADTRSLAAHKLRGPKGIGALVAREGIAIRPVLVGGSQERGIRPGTVDPVAAAGLGVAAAHARTSPARHATIAPLRDALERAILALAPGAEVNGGSARRVAHVTNVSVPGWIGAELVAALDLEGVAVASGSACSAGTIEPSPVLRAMHGEARARGAIRASLGETTTEGDVEYATAALSRVLQRAS
jgi:cysteine desulfurase